MDQPIIDGNQSVRMADASMLLGDAVRFAGKDAWGYLRIKRTLPVAKLLKRAK